jgi:hypothetical protein
MDKLVRSPISVAGNLRLKWQRLLSTQNRHVPARSLLSARRAFSPPQCTSGKRAENPLALGHFATARGQLANLCVQKLLLVCAVRTLCWCVRAGAGYFKFQTSSLILH